MRTAEDTQVAKLEKKVAYLEKRLRVATMRREQLHRNMYEWRLLAAINLLKTAAEELRLGGGGNHTTRFGAEFDLCPIPLAELALKTAIASSKWREESSAAFYLAEAGHGADSATKGGAL